MMNVHHRRRMIHGHELFYREAGDPSAPTLVLLHGYPTSSFMFRELIPLLADRYHIVAPDHLGFGLSAAPSEDEFAYSFDSLADITEAFLADLGIDRYAIYVQDYGAPTGWRLATRRPDAITAIITQNGNAYEDGFVDDFWAPVLAYQREQTPTTETAIRGALDVDAIRWQYLTGVDAPPGRPRHVAPRSCPGLPTRQRRHPADALPRLRHERRHVPAPPRVLPGQSGPAPGGLG